MPDGSIAGPWLGMDICLLWGHRLQSRIPHTATLRAGQGRQYDTDILGLALEAVRVGGGATRRDLARLKRAERTFVERLRDNRDPPAPEVVERAYARLVRSETALGGDGKAERLAKLQAAYDDWQKRRSTDAVVEHVAQVRAANGGELPSSHEMSAKDMARAVEFAALVREAGWNAGARRRGERVEPEPRHRLGGLRLPPR
jgi:hypothetical protein